MAKRKLVALVTMKILTPYRINEVFCETPENAEKLLHPNMTKGDFGPIYPEVKVRRFNPDSDMPLLLSNRSLNKKDHDVLMKKLNPDYVPAEVTAGEFESAISNILDKYRPVDQEETIQEATGTENPPRRGPGRPAKATA